MRLQLLGGFTATDFVATWPTLRQGFRSGLLMDNNMTMSKGHRSVLLYLAENSLPMRALASDGKSRGCCG